MVIYWYMRYRLALALESPSTESTRVENCVVSSGLASPSWSRIEGELIFFRSKIAGIKPRLGAYIVYRHCSVESMWEEKPIT